MPNPPPVPDSSGVPAPTEPRRGRGVFRPREDHPRDRRRSRPYRKHGLDRLKSAVRLLGARTLDRRTAVGKALAEWRANLVADLGGSETISTQQAAVVDVAVRTKLLLDSIDAWLLRQPSLVDRRRRAVLPVVRERQQLADALARYMTQLGLERRRAKPQALGEYIAQKYGGPAGEPAKTGPQESPAGPSPGKPDPAKPAAEGSP